MALILKLISRASWRMITGFSTRSVTKENRYTVKTDRLLETVIRFHQYSEKFEKIRLDFTIYTIYCNILDCSSCIVVHIENREKSIYLSLFTAVSQLGRDPEKGPWSRPEVPQAGGPLHHTSPVPPAVKAWGGTYCSFRSVNCFSRVVISSRHSILLLSQSSSSISAHTNT